MYLNSLLPCSSSLSSQCSSPLTAITTNVPLTANDIRIEAIRETVIDDFSLLLFRDIDHINVSYVLVMCSFFENNIYERMLC